MPSQKAEKIDLKAEYPCPCGRRGHLCPIVLTEAFGCNKCQQIFVVEEDGYAIEQLSTNYPYKRTWRWTGREWTGVYSGLREHYRSVALTVSVPLIVFVSLCFLLPLKGFIIFVGVIVVLLLVLLVPLIQRLAYRRSSR